MTYEEFPDVDRLSMCHRCQRWVAPEAGSEINVGAVSGGDAAVNAIGAFLPFSLHRSAIRFVCFSCQKRRLKIRLIVYGSLGFFLLVTVLAKVLGLI